MICLSRLSSPEHSTEDLDSLAQEAIMLGKRAQGIDSKGDNSDEEGSSKRSKSLSASCDKSRRFLSACMEDIVPVMEQRGKDSMFQCCYCSKWCTISGTRALSKHIENEHRPQVITKFLSDVSHLSVNIGPGETRLVYVAFVPLEHWNVQIEAAVSFSSPTNHPWASLHRIEDISNKERPNRGLESLSMKVASAQPYIPRPTWDEEKHCKQRMGMRVASSLKEAFDVDERGQRPTTGFVVKFEGFAGLNDDRAALGEVDVTFNLHGKETAFVLPLSLVVRSGVASRSGSSPSLLKDQRTNSPEESLDISHISCTPVPSASIAMPHPSTGIKSDPFGACTDSFGQGMKTESVSKGFMGIGEIDKVPSIFVGRDEPAVSFGMSRPNSGGPHNSSGITASVSDANTGASRGSSFGSNMGSNMNNNLNPLLFRTLLQMGTNSSFSSMNSPGPVGSMGAMNNMPPISSPMGHMGSRSSSGQSQWGQLGGSQHQPNNSFGSQ